MKFTEEKLEKAFVELPKNENEGLWYLSLQVRAPAKISTITDNTKYIQKLSSFLNNKLDKTIIFAATIK